LSATRFSCKSFSQHYSIMLYAVKCLVGTVHKAIPYIFLCPDIFICPIAIAYSMGQIIKSYLSVYVSVRLRALSLSFLIDFLQNWHIHKTNSLGGQYRTTPSPIFAPQNPHFRPKGPESPCKY